MYCRLHLCDSAVVISLYDVFFGVVNKYVLQFCASCLHAYRLQYFDTVGWMTGSASGLQKTASKPLGMEVNVIGWGIIRCTLWATPPAYINKRA